MKLIFAILILISSSAFASLVNPLEKGKTFNGVEVAKRIELSTDDSKSELSLFGAGLRTKKVAFLNFDVYVASIYLDKSTKESLATSEKSVIQLSFLRDVSADKVESSFKDALSVNDVDLTGSGIAALLQAVKDGGEALKGKAITIALDRKKSDAFYEDANGKVHKFKIQNGDVDKILSIWVGKPADSGLSKLKEEIFNG